MLEAVVWQRPVGQGGFSVGEVSLGGGDPVRWVYDCGSNQSDPLTREIGKVAGPIDLLFLSHLDGDHINGLDRLLWARPCAEVVLPYLDDAERLLALHDAGDGDFSASFAEFMADPAAWLLRRGVSRVTFVRGRDDGDSFTDPPPDGVGGGEGPLSLKWSRPRTPDPSRSPELAGDVGVVDRGAILMIAAGGKPIDWVLAPHVYPPPEARLRAFVAQLASAFAGQSPRQIAAAIWSAPSRAQLRRCYDALWADHNLVSMSLYAGPSGRPGRQWRGRVRGGSGDDVVDRRFDGPFGMGWVATGDANLAGARRRNAFLAAYRRYLPKLAVLIAPHHGATTSFDARLLSEAKLLIAGVAAAGPNGYGHPHDAVRQAVNAMELARFVHVSDAEPSGLELRLEAS